MDMPGLGRVIAVSSGKGGVGKSTVSVNLAVGLALDGYRVGLMDGDIYGPNIPRMLGLFERPPVVQGRIQPLEAYGVKLISLGLIIERDAPAIWRGPIIMKVIQQFLRDVDWGQLDYFIVDLPPGTGDAQLSLVQSVAVSGAVIVTTPQEVAVGDALRGAKMFERVNVPVFGVVENMSGFTDPESGRHWTSLGQVAANASPMNWAYRCWARSRCNLTWRDSRTGDSRSWLPPRTAPRPARSGPSPNG